MRKANRYAMPKRVRSSVKKDLVQFAIPGIAVFVLELSLIGRDALRGFWMQLWGMISHPSSMADLPALTVVGMFLFIIGLTIMCWGQLTLYKNYSGTVVIHEGHELVTRGIYNYVRNPMYFGLIIGVCFGLPAFGLSIRGFLVSLLWFRFFLTEFVLKRSC